MVKIQEFQMQQKALKLNLIRNLTIGKVKTHMEECIIMKLGLDNTICHNQCLLKKELFRVCEILLDRLQDYLKLKTKVTTQKIKMTIWEVLVQHQIGIIQIHKVSKIQSHPYQQAKVKGFTSLAVWLTLILNCKLIKIIFFNSFVIFLPNLDQRDISQQKTN